MILSWVYVMTKRNVSSLPPPVPCLSQKFVGENTNHACRSIRIQCTLTTGSLYCRSSPKPPHIFQWPSLAFYARHGRQRAGWPHCLWGAIDQHECKKYMAVHLASVLLSPLPLLHASHPPTLPAPLMRAYTCPERRACSEQQQQQSTSRGERYVSLLLFCR